MRKPLGQFAGNLGILVENIPFHHCEQFKLVFLQPSILCTKYYYYIDLHHQIEWNLRNQNVKLTLTHSTASHTASALMAIIIMKKWQNNAMKFMLSVVRACTSMYFFCIHNYSACYNSYTSFFTLQGNLHECLVFALASKIMLNVEKAGLIIIILL